MSSTELTTPSEMTLNPNNSREREILVVEREFALTQRKAKVLAASSIVPKDYQNNLANCVIAMEMASRLNAGELEIMQNLHIIHGRPSFSASYLIAQVNKSGVLKGRLRFKTTGEKNTDTWGCIAYGVDRETGEVLEGTEVTIAIAKAEGWYQKNGSKWKTMPEQMLQYRAASFWSRVYAPDATMGMHTVEERYDIEEKDITPQKQTASVSDLQLTLKKQEAEAAPEIKCNEETGEVLHEEELILPASNDQEEHIEQMQQEAKQAASAEGVFGGKSA